MRGTFCIHSRSCYVLEPVSHQLSPSFTQQTAHKGIKDSVKENRNFGRIVERSLQVCAVAGKWSMSVSITAAL